MLVTTHFSVPAEIAGRLLSKELVRRGGVIQWAPGTERAGEVVTWLRETQLAPSNASALTSGLGRAASALQMVGSVASIVNVGATVCFGAATLAKLRKLEAAQTLLQRTVEAGFGRVESSIAALNDKLTIGLHELNGNIDVGFEQMARGFATLVAGQERLGQKLEAEFEKVVIANLRSAAADMQLALELPPDSPARVTRIEHVLARVSPAYEWLAHDATLRVAGLVERVRSASSPRQRLNVTSEDVAALARVRMAVSAAAQRAKVVAEAGQPGPAAIFLSQAVERLTSLRNEVGSAFFCSTADALVYDDLLHHEWASHGISPERVGMWATRFDPANAGLGGVLAALQRRAAASTSLNTLLDEQIFPLKAFNIRVQRRISDVIGEALNRKDANGNVYSLLPEPQRSQAIAAIQKATTSGLTAIDEAVDWPEQTRAYLPVFLDLLDGLTEDLDRIEGHASEYNYMATRRMRVAAYCERFRVEETPENATGILFVEGDDEDEDEDEHYNGLARERRGRRL